MNPLFTAQVHSTGAWQSAWLWCAAVYAAASAVTFIVYGVDKNAARRQQRRVPEARLHLLEFLGGWPGALIAQRVFRHKTRKLSYQLVFWCIGAAHAGAWWWFTR